MSENSFLCEFHAQVSQIVLLADLTILRLITTARAKMSENSYLREFCSQVTQIVFLADLTVLLLFTTVWRKMSQNSYLHEFCAQVSQNVFLADLTEFCFLQMYEGKCHKTHICASSEHKCHKRVLSWFDHLKANNYGMDKNVTNHISPRTLCTSITNCVLSWFDRFMVKYNCMS